MNVRKLSKIAIKKGAVQKLTELSPLIKLLKRRKINIVLEIGTFKGGTLYMLCKIARPNAMLISIDLPGGPFGGGYQKKILKNLRII